VSHNKDNVDICVSVITQFVEGSISYCWKLSQPTQSCRH